MPHIISDYHNGMPDEDEHSGMDHDDYDDYDDDLDSVSRDPIGFTDDNTPVLAGPNDETVVIGGDNFVQVDPLEDPAFDPSAEDIRVITIHEVRMTVEMPADASTSMTEDTSQGAFADAVAEVTDTTPGSVSISEVAPATNAARRLVADGTLVSFSINVASKGAASTLIASGKLSKQDLSPPLVRRGLPGIDSVVEEPSYNSKAEYYKRQQNHTNALVLGLAFGGSSLFVLAVACYKYLQKRRLAAQTLVPHAYTQPVKNVKGQNSSSASVKSFSSKSPSVATAIIIPTKDKLSPGTQPKTDGLGPLIQGGPHMV